MKIKEFAAAIGDSNPIYRDREAAQAAGHPDVIAPPTFPIVFSLQSGGGALADPDLGLNFAMVVHGEQRFEYTRPDPRRRRAGQRPRPSPTSAASAATSCSTSRSDVTTVEGEPVCTDVQHDRRAGRGGLR